MAVAAYRAAANIAPFGANIVGVGCSCALATDRSKKGDHKARQKHFFETPFPVTQALLCHGIHAATPFSCRHQKPYTQMLCVAPAHYIKEPYKLFAVIRCCTLASR